MQSKSFLTQQREQKWNKIKIGIFTAMIRFPNHTLKLKAPDQPQSAMEETLLTNDITQLLVQRFVKVFHQNQKKLMFSQNIL